MLAFDKPYNNILKYLQFYTCLFNTCLNWVLWLFFLYIGFFKAEIKVQKVGPANSDGRASVYQFRDPSSIPSRGNLFCAVAEKMCSIDFPNNSGKWNAIYWNNAKADFTLSVWVKGTTVSRTNTTHCTEGSEDINTPSLQQQLYQLDDVIQHDTHERSPLSTGQEKGLTG